jgi:tellurite resistance protein TerC
MLTIWIGFLVLVCIALALDLGVFHRDNEVISYRSSLKWTLIWVSVALSFTGVVYALYHAKAGGLGTERGMEDSPIHAVSAFVSGYVVEYSLSVDNIFVIALVMAAFKVPRELQHRVLFWGILGALLMRGVMIALGAVLLHRFQWMMYVFGAILVITAIRMALQKEDDNPEHVADSWLVRQFQAVVPTTRDYHGQSFFVREADGKLRATPLFLVLLVVESTDVLFAIDSIPAVFAVTTDTFIVFTSNVFAILGLRSLYFAVAGLLHQFEYLKASLVVLLAFIGAKMLAHEVFVLSQEWSLLAIALILGVGVGASILKAKKNQSSTEGPVA